MARDLHLQEQNVKLDYKLQVRYIYEVGKDAEIMAGIPL